MNRVAGPAGRARGRGHGGHGVDFLLEVAPSGVDGEEHVECEGVEEREGRGERRRDAAFPRFHPRRLFTKVALHAREARDASLELGRLLLRSPSVRPTTANFDA